MFKNYLTSALRSLTKRKKFTVINVFGLVLSFCCCTLIYLFIYHHLHFDDFHQEAERIYRFATEEHQDGVEYDAAVPPGFAHAFQADYPYAELVAKTATRSDQLITITPDKKLKETVNFVEPTFFDIFNFPLVAGHEATLQGKNQALITQRAARKFFGDQEPIGQVFQLDGKAFITVTGILQDLPTTSLIQGDVFVSFETMETYSGFLAGESWGGINSSLRCYARLYPHQDIAKIETEINGYVAKFRPTSKNVHHYKLQRLPEIHFDARYAGGINPNMLWIFGVIGVFLLLVASINFVNISTALSATRSKEVGVRKVLGSRRHYLFWQFMIESGMIIVVAFALGLIFAITALPYFNTTFNVALSMAPLYTPQALLGMVAMLSIMIALSGSYPGMILARIAPLLALKGKLTAADAGGKLIREMLVVVQFVISMLLLIGMITVNKQLDYAIHSDLGFDQQDVVMVPLPTTLTATRLVALKHRMARITGVEKVSACFASPGAGDSDWGTSLQYDQHTESEEFSIQAKAADVNYLNTFNLQLVAGRNFIEKDSVDELLVNATFAEKVGAASPEDVLGKTLSINRGFIAGTIVGVVEDFHDQDFHAHISPIFITPMVDMYNELAIKINRMDNHRTLKQIEDEWNAVYPDYLFEYAFLDDRVSAQYEAEQQFLSLTRLFSAITLFIGCLGIYGLILFFVAQRKREIGIRKVLGGSLGHILMRVSRDFFRLLIAGAFIAIPPAWYFVTQWLARYTYRTPVSWWIFALATGIVATITLLTIAYQALKAALSNPVDSLRTE